MLGRQKINWNNWNWNALTIYDSPKRLYYNKIRQYQGLCT